MLIILVTNNNKLKNFIFRNTNYLKNKKECHWGLCLYLLGYY